MTRKQQEFYRILANQMIDYNEDFHKEFTINRISKIPDEKLKYLLEDINVDPDKIVRKKGYITYSKFIYYADKMIESFVNKAALPEISKVEQLYKKRDILLKTIEDQASGISERNQLVEKLQNRLLMFKEKGKNILDAADYYIIDKIGFYKFFDENSNYHLKEEIEKHFKEYLSKKIFEKNSNIKQLKNL